MTARLEELVKRRDEINTSLKVMRLRESALLTRLGTVESELQSICPHSEVKKISKYHEGGYDHTNNTDHWTVCELCGKTVDHWNVNHGSYA